MQYKKHSLQFDNQKKNGSIADKFMSSDMNISERSRDQDSVVFRKKIYRKDIIIS